MNLFESKLFKDKKLLAMHIFGFSLLIIIFLGVFFGMPFVKDTQKSTKTELKPIKSEGANTPRQYFAYDVSKVNKSTTSLIIFTGHQQMRVFADGKEIYSVQKGEGIFARTTGPRWDYVDIPEDTQKVEITLDAVYKSIPMKDFTVYVGNAKEELFTRLRNSFPAACLDYVISLIGMALVGFWIIERKNATTQRSVLYFGFFVMLVGLWCLNETEFFTIIIPNRCGASFFSFMMLMVMPIPYVKYLTTFMDTGKKRFAKLIVNLTVINTCVCVFLHLTGIASVKQTAITEQLLLVDAAVYHIWTLIAYYRKKGMDKLLLTNLIGMTGFMFTAFFDLWHYYSSMQKNPVIAHFGLLISMSVMGWSALSSAKRNVDDMKSVSLYKKIALKDLQTGLFNRNAYDKIVYEQKDFTDTAIVVFDINNLKKCNDTLGHESGDRLINSASALIKEYFGKFGKIYRIGGDEFCGVLNSKNKSQIIDNVEKFKKIQSVSDNLEEVSVACGYAFFNGEKDKDIEDTRKRADVFLYEDKKKMKLQIKKAMQAVQS